MAASSLFVDLLMCALKRAPIVGTAAEVIDSIRQRAELTCHDNRISDLERQITEIDGKIHDAVFAEVRRIFDTLSVPNLSGPTLTEEMRTLLSIRASGWDPKLSEGVVRNSSHWKELHRAPQNYGRVLKDDETCALEAIQLLVDVDGPKILELSPFAFSSLLCNQSAGIPPARIYGSQDVWVVRDDGQFSATRTSDVKSQQNALLIRLNRESIDQADESGWDSWIVELIRAGIDLEAIRAHYTRRYWSKLPAFDPIFEQPTTQLVKWVLMNRLRELKDMRLLVAEIVEKFYDVKQS